MLVALLACALVLLASPPAAHAAAAGDLDPAFGSGGKVQTDFKQAELGSAAASTADGRIVVAGRQTVVGAGTKILVVRYLATGALDTSFGQGGAVVDVVGKNLVSSAAAVAVQPDGKIVVAGSTNAGGPNDDTAVVRYLPDGTRDTGFGTGGAATFDIGNGGSDGANAVAILPDGRIALAIDAPNAQTEWTIAILNADGTANTQAFGFPAPSSPNAMAVTGDGKLVVAGFGSPNGTPDFGFARYLSSTRPDTGFGNAGRSTVDFTGGDDEAFGVAVASDGSVFASGFTTLPAGAVTGAVVKLTAAGVPDGRFGQNGRVTVDFGTPVASVGAVVLQADGSVVVAGSAGDKTTRQFALARLTPSGALDPTFGRGGRVLTPFTGQDSVSALRLSTAGALVAVGTTGPSGSSDLALAQYRTTATTTATTAPTTTTTTVARATSTTAPPSVTTTVAGPTTTAPPGPPPPGGTGSTQTPDGGAPTGPIGGGSAGRPRLVVSSSRANVGSRVTATAFAVPATGCAKVFFLMDGRVVGTATRDAGGQATGALRVGESFAPGRHRLSGSCSARAGDTFAAASIGVVGARRSAFVRAVSAPSALSTEARVLATNALLALLVVLLVAFPAELFNSTYDANYEEVTGWFAPWRRRLGAARGHGASAAGSAPARSPSFERWTPRLQLAGFLLAGAVIYGLLDPGFGFNRSSLALVAGLLIGLFAVTVSFSAARVLYVRRRFGERGRFECRPGSIAVAVVCVLLSRVLHFEPGYVFGLIGGYVVARELPRDDEGAITAAGAVVVLVVGALAWVAWVPVSHQAARAGANVAVLAADAALASVFVASIEGLALGLLPLRFLNGSRVMAWSRPAWAVLFGVSVFIFVHALLHPEDGYVSTSPRASVFAVVAIAGAFGLGSVAFWGYFRFRRPRAETRVV